MEWNCLDSTLSLLKAKVIPGLPIWLFTPANSDFIVECTALEWKERESKEGESHFRLYTHVMFSLIFDRKQSNPNKG